jgi:hypothetical protein
MTTPTAAQPQRRLDVASALNHFGGAKNLVHLMAAKKIKPAPNYEAVKKWRQRGSIPAPYLAAMVTLGQRVGKAFNLTRHMTTDNTTTHHEG